MSLTPLQDYTLNASRLGIISSNKEGLVSLLGKSFTVLIFYVKLTGEFPGYLAIHLVGLSTGTILLPASPSDFRRLRRQLQKNGDGKLDVNSSSSGKPQYRQNDKIAIELFSYATLWWIGLGVSSLLNVGGGVSRRLVRELLSMRSVS